MPLWKNTSEKMLIDTNVALRYLLQDNEVMAAKAQEIISSGGILLPEVLAEVVYVLQKVYKVSRHETYESLKDLLAETESPDPLVLERAVDLYGETTLDFVDCVLIAHNHVEKTPKTPPKEILLAKTRREDYLHRKREENEKPKTI